VHSKEEGISLIFSAVFSASTGLSKADLLPKHLNNFSSHSHTE